MWINMKELIPELYLDYHKAGLVGFIDYSLMKNPKLL